MSDRREEGVSGAAARPRLRTVSVLLVDNASIVRARLRARLETRPCLRVVGEAGDAAAARQLLRQLRPDAVILDIQMPGESGLVLLPWIREHYPQCRVLMLSSEPAWVFGPVCRKLGAETYLWKGENDDRIVECLERGLTGRGAETG